MERRIVLAAALALSVPLALLSLPKQAEALPGGRCTRETLNVKGTPLNTAFCVVSVGTASPGRDLPVRVSATYSTPRASWNQEVVLQFISGEESSRVIQDLPLDRVGLQGTLHLTLLLRGGAVHVDSAMLTPGAVTIK